MRLLSTVLSLLLLACNSNAAVEINPARTIVIEGVIARGNLDKLGDVLVRVSNVPSPAPVDLIINSPGGEIITGNLFISKMEAAKANGLVIRCFVPHVAASMAFSIYMHCSERYALRNALLLWHRARMYVGGLFGAPLTGPQAKYMGEELLKTDSLILRDLFGTIDMSEEEIRYHFENETLHNALLLHEAAPHFVTPFTYIKGLFEALSNKKLLRNEQPSMFGIYKDGDIIYIHPSLDTSIPQTGVGK